LPGRCSGATSSFSEPPAGWDTPGRPASRPRRRPRHSNVARPVPKRASSSITAPSAS
jgi:hypothetical protein